MTEEEEIKCKARQFWQWFASVANEFASNFKNEAILNELDKRIASFGKIVWEVGPGQKMANALVISPGGETELLELSRQIIAQAPELSGWEFHHVKPPKQWKLQFIVENLDGTPLDIDANGWEYVLLRFPDGSFDIIVYTHNLKGVHEDTRQLAAEIAVEGIIGEACRIQHVGGIEAVTELEETHKGKAGNLKLLREHINSLMTPKLQK